MPQNIAPYQQKTDLQNKLDSIEKIRKDINNNQKTQTLNKLTLNKLTQELQKLQQCVDLEMAYETNLNNMTRNIAWLKRNQPKSPFIAYGEEILKLTKLRANEFNEKSLPEGMTLQQLSETLSITNKTIRICTGYGPGNGIHIPRNELSQEMMNTALQCTALALKIAPPEHVKIDTRKRMRGLLIGIAGVLLILARVAVAVATYGAATPLSIAGISLGISFIAAGAAMGTAVAVSGAGLFSESKPHAIKIKETLENIATEATKAAKEEDKNKGPIYGGF